MSLIHYHAQSSQDTESNPSPSFYGRGTGRTGGISLLEIKTLPTVAGTMEGGLRIAQSSLRSTQRSVCVYINTLAPLGGKGEEERRGKGQQEASATLISSQSYLHIPSDSRLAPELLIGAQTRRVAHPEERLLCSLNLCPSLKAKLSVSSSLKCNLCHSPCGSLLKHHLSEPYV
ncbi:hypothetical protein NQZ68_034757 [Dissostichus eleginoides]|nr:hypothetical protein NQZ68_034757 [Dissostichus eleginoides]